MSDFRVSCLARHTGQGAARPLFWGVLGVLGLSIMATLFAGCGGGSGDAVLATVGDHEILASYYEDRLSKLDASELPQDENGLPLDTSTLEGKKAFLEVMRPSEETTILDVGFSENEYSEIDNFLQKHYPHPEKTTALGIDTPNKFLERYP